MERNPASSLPNSSEYNLARCSRTTGNVVEENPVVYAKRKIESLTSNFALSS
jgi:hypothetical protein